MRFFARIQYNGSVFCGWQRQPNQPTVQQTIEDTLSKVLRNPIQIHGCGRTDTGVHASEYFFHFDHDSNLSKDFEKKITGILPPSIVIEKFIPVSDDAHARYDATSRSYTYFISGKRDPFREKTIYHFPFYDHLDFDKMKMAADLLTQYEDFFPFCKTHSDVNNYRCEISNCQWVKKGDQLTFYISANRFLRGMIRLIVGMSLNVGLNKITLKDVENALNDQSRLTKALSVPPSGLFLSKVEYPFIKA